MKFDALDSDLALYIFRSGSAASKDAFFDAARPSLPLDPLLEGPNNSWDAFSDSFFGGIYELDGPGVVILWPDAYAMKVSSPRDFEIAVGALSQVSDSLSNPRTTANRNKLVAVYVVESSG